MKANKAPERLYLSENIYSTYLYQVPDPDDETAVEYTRTDAFIEKACNFIDERLNFDDNAWYIEGEVTVKDKVIDDFKNYMKEV